VRDSRKLAVGVLFITTATVIQSLEHMLYTLTAVLRLTQPVEWLNEHQLSGRVIIIINGKGPESVGVV